MIVKWSIQYYKKRAFSLEVIDLVGIVAEVLLVVFIVFSQ